MSEPGNVVRSSSLSYSRSASDRAKSLRDIDEQYSRIENRLYRQYLDFDIDEDTYKSRMNRINNAYDRYQTNYIREINPNWSRGMSYPMGFRYDKKVSRKVYAK